MLKPVLFLIIAVSGGAVVVIGLPILIALAVSFWASMRVSRFYQRGYNAH